jgi:hypothetical protein
MHRLARSSPARHPVDITDVESQVRNLDSGSRVPDFLERQRKSGDVATQPLELLSLIGPTGHGSVQRKAVAGRGAEFGRHCVGVGSAQGLQAQGVGKRKRAIRSPRHFYTIHIELGKRPSRLELLACVRISQCSPAAG